MGKRWVFQELVKKQDDGSLDVIGYVAYALYKAKKDSLATSLRSQQTPEEEIERRLREFHENTVISSDECSTLRKRAEEVINESFESALADMESTLTSQLETAKNRSESEYQRKLKELEKERKSFEKEKKTLSTKVRKEESNKIYLAAKDVTKPNRLIRSALWMWNGFSGLIATVFVGIVIFGSLVYFGDGKTKQEVIGHAIEWTTNTLTNNPLPDTSTQGQKPE